ncbi:unnamed protein product [Cercopithifilaria johnstoni]|uniref:Uncharacterized protein n=1 Tax=Cercopithifilaria johnstoni TaxID=2874296 RepID=A0A8J2M588_9BILA|nr:unnamed protein product [Cercopithifilaria johnstoni]
MANRRYSTDQYNTITPQPKTSSHSETFNPNCALSQQSHANTTKKHFFFSTSNIRFWTTGRSGKKTSREKLSNSASDIVNHGDQLRYVKEERNTLRRIVEQWDLMVTECALV